MYDETVAFLKNRLPAPPSLAIVLGSGLGGFADELSERIEIPYAEIPGWPPSTAVGHAGKLVYGTIGGVHDRRAFRPRAPVRRLLARAGDVRRPGARIARRQIAGADKRRWRHQSRTRAAADWFSSRTTSTCKG